MAYKWIQSSAYSSVPPDAVIGGNDENGDMIYVGRAEHEGSMLVCKVVPSKQIGFVSHRGEALPKDIFEMLCGQNLVWLKCYDHVIPERAVLCGRTTLDQPVYIGRGHYEGHLIIGKISSVHRALFIAFRGAERRLDSYEILVEQEGATPGWKLPPVDWESEKCSMSPPAPPSPPPPPPPLIEAKKYTYPYPELQAMPFPMTDLPPRYTPLPQGPAFASPAVPAVVMSPPPAPSYTPSIVHVSVPPAAPTSFTPAATFVPPPQSYTPAEYAPAQTYAPSMPGPGHTTHESDIWVHSNYSSGSPYDAVTAGHDTDMTPLLVCRALYNGNHIPGKASPSRGCAYISHAGLEIVESSYEVLVGQSKYHWVHARSGSIAPGAVVAGRTQNGEPLYIGRAHYCGSLTPGKIHPSHGCLYIPFGGTEQRITNYEVLVRSEHFHRFQAISLSY